MAHSSPADNISTDEVRDFFDDAMSEEGIELDSVEVKVWDDGFPSNTNIGIQTRKRINGDDCVRRTDVSLTDAKANDPGYLRQQLATLAREMAKEYEEAMVDTIDVCGTQLEFCAAEGGWVRCKRCDEQVTLSSVLRDSLVFTEEAELSHPSPSPYDIQSFLRTLDDDEREVLKYYLLGELRNYCKCRFGKHNMYATRQ